MEKVSGKVFVSTSIENIMYDGTDASFIGGGFPNAKVRDVFTGPDKSWFVFDDQIISKKNEKYEAEKIPFPISGVMIQNYLIDGNKEYFGTNKGLWLRSGKEEIKLINDLNVLSIKKIKGRPYNYRFKKRYLFPK